MKMFLLTLLVLSIFPSIKSSASPSYRNASLDVLHGSLRNGVPTYEESNNFLRSLCDKHPELIKDFTIGKSIEMNPIRAYRVGGTEGRRKMRSADTKALTDLPVALITGMHHARESASLSLILHFIANIIDLYEGDLLTKFLLDTREIWIIPYVNPDGFAEISKTHNFSIRKNRRKTCKKKNSDTSEQGVDLNRNYAAMFSENTAGPCEEEFAGAYAFSEPETQAVKNLVEQYQHNDLGQNFVSPPKILLNLHSFGNLWIRPWNCAAYMEKETPDSRSNRLKEYGDIFDFIGVEESGSAVDLLNYSTCGESDDWAYSSHGIYSMSLELGSEIAGKSEDEQFWPEKDILAEYNSFYFQKLLRLIMKGGTWFKVKAWNYKVNNYKLSDDFGKFSEENAENSLLPEKVKQSIEQELEALKGFPTSGSSCRIVGFNVQEVGLQKFLDEKSLHLLLSVDRPPSTYRLLNLSDPKHANGISTRLLKDELAETLSLARLHNVGGYGNGSTKAGIFFPTTSYSSDLMQLAVSGNDNVEHPESMTIKVFDEGGDSLPVQHLNSEQDNMLVTLPANKDAASTGRRLFFMFPGEDVASTKLELKSLAPPVWCIPDVPSFNAHDSDSFCHCGVLDLSETSNTRLVDFDVSIENVKTSPLCRAGHVFITKGTAAHENTAESVKYLSTFNLGYPTFYLAGYFITYFQVILLIYTFFTLFSAARLCLQGVEIKSPTLRKAFHCFNLCCTKVDKLCCCLTALSIRKPAQASQRGYRQRRRRRLSSGSLGAHGNQVSGEIRY